MQSMKLHTQVHHRNGTNRHGRKITLRHASLPGVVAVDRKTGAWAYKERRDDSGALVVVEQSRNWSDYMDAFRPDYVPVTAEWVKRIQLRERARH